MVPDSVADYDKDRKASVEVGNSRPEVGKREKKKLPVQWGIQWRERKYRDSPRSSKWFLQSEAEMIGLVEIG